MLRTVDADEQREGYAAELLAVSDTLPDGCRRSMGQRDYLVGGVGGEGGVDGMVRGEGGQVVWLCVCSP